MKNVQNIPGYISPMGGERFIGLRPNMPIIYVAIPKNAHTFTTKFMSDNLKLVNMTAEHLSSCTNIIFNYLVVFRDPVDRWFTGMAEYVSSFSSESVLSLLDNRTFCDIVFNRMWFDEHTKPQSYFLLDVDLKKTVFFKCDEHLEDTLTAFVKRVIAIDTPVVTNDMKNARSTSAFKEQVYAKLQSIVADNPHYYEKLMSFTKADRQLIEQVTNNNLWYIAR